MSTKRIELSDGVWFLLFIVIIWVGSLIDSYIDYKTEALKYEKVATERRVNPDN